MPGMVPRGAMPGMGPRGAMPGMGPRGAMPGMGPRLILQAQYYIDFIIDHLLQGKNLNFGLRSITYSHPTSSSAEKMKML